MLGTSASDPWLPLGECFNSERLAAEHPRPGAAFVDVHYLCEADTRVISEDFPIEQILAWPSGPARKALDEVRAGSKEAGAVGNTNTDMVHFPPDKMFAVT